MKMRDPEHHKSDNAPPEVALVAVVEAVVASKAVVGVEAAVGVVTVDVEAVAAVAVVVVLGQELFRASRARRPLLTS